MGVGLTFVNKDLNTAAIKFFFTSKLEMAVNEVYIHHSPP